jgi:hypothetical protein
LSPLEQVKQLRGVSYLWKWEGGASGRPTKEEEGPEAEEEGSDLPAHMRGHARMRNDKNDGGSARKAGDGDGPVRRQLGFIAQEVEEVVPEMVHTDSDGFKSVAYARLLPVVVEAIKEQDLKHEKEMVLLREDNAKLVADVRLLKEQGVVQQEAMKEMRAEFAALRAGMAGHATA